MFLGALVAIDGIWRSTGTLVPMRPAEGDAASALVHEGDRRPDPGAERQAHARSYGSIRGSEATRRARGGDRGGRADARDLISNVVSNLLPVLAGELWERRAAGAALTNTDGHRLALITGLVQVDEPAAAAERLAAHEDFRTEEDGELTWWGRELSEMEQQTALATVRAEAGEDAAEYDQTPALAPGAAEARRRRLRD